MEEASPMTGIPRVIALVSCLLVVAAGAALGDTGLGRHKKVYAVPVPAKVAIDGRLDDWDLSGQIFMYVVSETSEMQSARVALMYDAEALYLSGVVRDPTPMMNRHDPAVDPDRAWDADVCQIFLSLDPALGYPIQKSSFNKDESDKMCTLLLWYFTDRQEPNLAALKAMTFSKALRPDLSATGVIPRDRFQAAYRKADDGRGYTFEYRIPWATLGMKPARAGDVLAASVCVFWGTADGLKTAGGGAWCYDVMAGPGFVFQSSNVWGKIIFAGKGSLAKDLVEEGLPPEKPVPLTFSYEVPEDGEVSIALVDAGGRVARTLVASGPRRAGTNVERWDGLDNAGKPMPPGTYTWRGLYHQPLKTKFVLSAHNSGQPPYKTDDNTGGWGGDHGNPTSVCATGDAMFLSWNMSESGWGIIKTDLKGKKLWGVRHNAEDMATDGERLFVVGDHGYEGEDSVKVFDAKDGRPLNWGNGKPFLAPPEGGDDKTNVAAAVAYCRGLVYVSWTVRDLVASYDVQGNLKEARRIPRPGRLAAHPHGVLVVTKGESVKLLAGKGPDGTLSEHVEEPAGVAVDADGSIYVANAGRLQNISVFDAKGNYLRSIGKPGGRPRVGRYDAGGILEAGGIAIDKAGNLWVAETLDGPKRHSVWDTKTGKLVAEFFGGSSYFGWAYMDPRRPDELYCHNVLWKIDLDKGACVPWSTIWRPTAPNMIQMPNPGGYAGHFRVFTAANGKQFGWGMIDYSNMLFIRNGDVFKPFAGTIRIAFGQYGGGVLYPVMKDRAKFPEGAYLWQDSNNDQTVQEDELTKSPAGRGEAAFNWIGPDLCAWSDAGFLLRPVRFEADGRPVYDFSRREPVPFKGSNGNATSLWLDNQDDSVYTLNPGCDVGFARWTRDGKLLWGYGGVMEWNQALSLPMITPGRLYGLTMPLGVAGDFTGAACYFGPYHIYTRDGVCVGMVMRDGRSGGLGPDITASEVITGQLVKPDGMNRYFLLAGDQDGRVTEILGLDTVRRLQGGAYVHTEEGAKLAAAALADYERARARAQRLEIVRGRAALDVAKGITKTVDASRAFTARAAYDERNLYVAFDVTSAAALVNEVSDPRIIFKGGNILDIQMAADPAADPKRKAPAPGDLRLLVTRQADKPVAVLYRPRVKGFSGQPIVLTSPTGKESFDAIEPVSHVRLDYAAAPGGFKAIVTIPLELLGWTPKPGTSVRMDLGYVFGNSTGSQASVRAYWTNSSFSANVTNDIPNESRLEPAEWGTATVE
jgi:hypothetical protein